MNMWPKTITNGQSAHLTAILGQGKQSFSSPLHYQFLSCLLAHTCCSLWAYQLLLFISDMCREWYTMEFGNKESMTSSIQLSHSGVWCWVSVKVMIAIISVKWDLHIHLLHLHTCVYISIWDHLYKQMKIGEAVGVLWLCILPNSIRIGCLWVQFNKRGKWKIGWKYVIAKYKMRDPSKRGKGGYCAYLKYYWAVMHLSGLTIYIHVYQIACSSP